jgi:hypothetical protein
MTHAHEFFDPEKDTLDVNFGESQLISELNRSPEIRFESVIRKFYNDAENKKECIDRLIEIANGYYICIRTFATYKSLVPFLDRPAALIYFMEILDSLKAESEKQQKEIPTIQQRKPREDVSLQKILGDQNKVKAFRSLVFKLLKEVKGEKKKTYQIMRDITHLLGQRIQETSGDKEVKVKPITDLLEMEFRKVNIRSSTLRRYFDFENYEPHSPTLKAKFNSMMGKVSQ